MFVARVRKMARKESREEKGLYEKPWLKVDVDNSRMK